MCDQEIRALRHIQQQVNRIHLKYIDDIKESEEKKESVDRQFRPLKTAIESLLTALDTSLRMVDDLIEKLDHCATKPCDCDTKTPLSGAIDHTMTKIEWRPQSSLPDFSRPFICKFLTHGLMGKSENLTIARWDEKLGFFRDYNHNGEIRHITGWFPIPTVD